jgi:hypothetical protein
MCRHADLQWRLTYVGSAESEEHDQVLDDVQVGPIAQGKFKFVLQVRPLNVFCNNGGSTSPFLSGSLCNIENSHSADATEEFCTYNTVHKNSRLPSMPMWL